MQSLDITMSKYIGIDLLLPGETDKCKTVLISMFSTISIYLAESVKTIRKMKVLP